MQNLHASQRLRPLGELADGRVYGLRGAGRDVDVDDIGEDAEPQDGGRRIV